MTQILEKNLQADIVATKRGLAGTYTVTVSFLVDQNGAVSEVKTINDPGYGTAA